jgi:two-component system NtrC family sensor kinase
MWGRRVDHTVEAALGGYPGKVYIIEQSSNKIRDGIYLYHKNSDLRFGNQLKSNYRFYNIVGSKLWQRIKKGPNKDMVEGADGAMYYYHKYSPYKQRDTRWVLMIEADRSTVLAPVIKLRNWIGFLIAAMLVLSLLIARWIASRLAAPVHELAQIITRYADGDKRASYRGERTDEIGHAGKAFNYLSSQLERTEIERDKAESAVRQSERLAAIGQMAAGIGHEINNPLMNIMSLTSLVQQSVPEDDKQLQEDIEAIQNEGRRCARIVQGILNFARETPPEYRHFDMSDLIGETVALLRHRFEIAGVVLENECLGSLPMEGDTSQLQQVLVNVLLNALHASPSGSTIKITTRQCDQSVCIEILDEGKGVKDKDIGRVFHPFFSTKGEGEGTGLGLSVSYGIIRKHGGSISLRNREQGGVKVSITMPLHGQAANKADSGEDKVRNAVNQY